MRTPVRSGDLALASILLFVATAAAQAPGGGQNPKGPPPEAGAAGGAPPGKGLRHVEGSPQPLTLDFGASGPLGSLVRSQWVSGDFVIPTQMAEDFESGALGASWSVSSSTTNGRIQVTSGSGGVADGDYALWMDTTVDGIYNLNEAVWTVDMTTVPSARLVFSYYRYNDELEGFAGDFTGSYNADGIAISDDGVRWHPVFTPDYAWWGRYTVDLAAEAAAAGMTLGASFRIKFQQYDNFSWPSDGIGYDGIAFAVPGADPDTFEVTLDPGLKLEVVLNTSGEVQGYVRVERGNALIAESLANAPGERVMLQAIDTLGQLGGGGVGPRTYRITVVNANLAMGYYDLSVRLNETSEREPYGGSTNDTVAGAESLGSSFVPLLRSVKAANGGRQPGRAAVQGVGGRKAVIREGFEGGALPGSWTASSSTPTGRIRVTDAAGVGAGSFALVMDNVAQSTATTATFYEQFFSGAANDLTGHAITMTPNGNNGYNVAASSVAYLAPAGNLGMGDDSTTVVGLGFSIDWPGYGPVSSITISSNGRIAPASMIDNAWVESTASFLASPQLCALWDDLNPGTGGGVYFDASPGMAVISWQGVPQYLSTGSNTFQIQILDTGVIHVVWSHVETDAIVGFSDGPTRDGELAAPDPGSIDLTASLPFSTSSSVGGAAAFNLNQATWNVDLTGLSAPSLRFLHASWNDDYHPFAGPFTGSYAADGVAISGDGVSWTPLLDLSGYYGGGYWSSYEIDLVAAAASAAIPLNANVWIRFQQYDNAAVPQDGFGFDDIEILASDRDHYRISLVAGESIAFYGVGSGLGLELVDANGVAVTSAVRQPIVNGSFESGLYYGGWQTSYTGLPWLAPGVRSTGYSPGSGLAPVQAQDGYYVFAHGFASRTTAATPPPYTFKLWQDFTLPAILPGPLSWLERIQWNFTAFGVPATQPRTHAVELRDPVSGALLTTLSSFATGTRATTPTGNTGWQRHEVDLSAYAGQNVRLVFTETIPEANTGSGLLEIDSVRIDGIPDNVDAFVPVFIAPATGDYFLRAAAPGSYEVFALRNAEFGFENNNTLAAAQPIQSIQAAGRRWVVGHADVPTVDPDFYAIRGTIGHTLVAETYTPGAGSGSFVNDLDPVVSLYDAAGNLIAQDDNSAGDGRNARLEFPFPANGDYYVAVNTQVVFHARENFESGVLGPQWTTTSSTPSGLVEVRSDFGAADGSKALVMGKSSSNQTYNLNQATLTCDLTGATAPRLRFAHRNIVDESHFDDGVFVSSDGGNNWIKVLQPSGSSVWTTYEIDLLNYTYYYGLTFGPNFKVRFQQYDNQLLPADGRAWDAISIFSNKPAGEYVLSIQGDG